MSGCGPAPRCSRQRRGGRRGPGIPPEHLPQVFERFYKADSARAGAGSGLGLAIALENARLLGGNISVSSDVAGGSVFRLTLPMGPPPM